MRAPRQPEMALVEYSKRRGERTAARLDNEPPVQALRFPPPRVLFADQINNQTWGAEPPCGR
jgi:hypothetical protein